jgi:hypothetical protein
LTIVLGAIVIVTTVQFGSFLITVLQGFGLKILDVL